MPPKLRITRNREANELSSYIQNDAAMMSALTSAVHFFWEQHKAEFAAAGKSNEDPSPWVILPTTDLIVTFMERKIASLKALPNERQTANELEVLLKKASLYPVADDILQASLPEYRPISETGEFELVDESTDAEKEPRK